MSAPEWLSQALAKSEITDLLLNGPDRIYMDRGAGLEPLSALLPLSPWSVEDMRNWIIEQITAAGKAWDARHPFIDATLVSGHRVHVAFPPLARQGLLISIRRLPSTGATQADAATHSGAPGITRWTTGTPRSAALHSRLVHACRAGDSILIAGATGSGKTTLAGDLLGEVAPSERILALEDTPELAPAHPHFISLISRPPNADGCGEVTLRTLLRQALRMRPDRIILGECRGAEVLDLLQAMNTGHRGLVATLHANSPRDALRRIELLCLLAGGGSVPLPAIRELLAVGVQWIAQVERRGRAREITDLCRVEGREGEIILLRSLAGSMTMDIPLAVVEN